ncbi:MAG: hypothetical protein NWQ13_07795 [Glaciimonas sp.]|nr:hypothetical protein [Glaciimonas sp.]
MSKPHNPQRRTLIKLGGAMAVVPWLTTHLPHPSPPADARLLT